MRKFNLFNFLEKKVSDAQIEAVVSSAVAELSFRELAFQIGVSYIANALSKCEIKTFKGGKEVREKLYYRLNVSPNPNENSSQFINKFVENYYYNGGALIVPQNDMLYCADSFDLDDSNPLKEYIYHNVVFGTKQVNKRFKSSEVFHMKLDNKDVKKLIDLIYAQYGEIMGLALQTFKRTNGKKYKLILEAYRAGDTSFNEAFENVIKKQLQTFIENDNSVYPQFKGTDLQEFSTAAPTTSADIIAMRKEIFETTAQGLKIPLPMMYGNITNINEIVKVFLTFCIDPLADMASEELTRKYYTYEEWKNGDFVAIDTSCINHVDILEVADKVEKLVGCGVANLDDMRKHIGWQPLGTKFSTSYFLTKNFDLAERVLNGQKGGDEE
jgi:HK97 family phage portal protein